MYYPFFIVYLVAGFLVTIWAFRWAIRNGQFRDQQRARFLPLDEGEGEQPAVVVSRSNRYQSYLLLGLAGSGLLALAAAVVYVLISGG